MPPAPSYVARLTCLPDSATRGRAEQRPSFQTCSDSPHVASAGRFPCRWQWAVTVHQKTQAACIAHNHVLCRIKAIAFVALVLMRLRAHDLQTNVAFETDWGQEFGGDNLSRVTRLSSRYLQPPGGDLCRYPLGRKGYRTCPPGDPASRLDRPR